jgi:hypothetical protein
LKTTSKVLKLCKAAGYERIDRPQRANQYPTGIGVVLAPGNVTDWASIPRHFASLIHLLPSMLGAFVIGVLSDLQAPNTRSNGFDPNRPPEFKACSLRTT